MDSDQDMTDDPDQPPAGHGGSASRISYALLAGWIPACGRAEKPPPGGPPATPARQPVAVPAPSAPTPAARADSPVVLTPTPKPDRALPEFAKEDLAHEDRVAAFVAAFIEHDAQGGTLLNPSNRALFAQGYRPKIGVPHDPEIGGQRFSDIRSYFTKKLYLDLSSIRPLDEPTFQSFVDQVGRWADQTLICAGEISIKYNLNVEGPFNFENELAKIPAGPEREEFKSCWLNDFVLGTELRMLAWIYGQLFNTPYVTPEKR